MELEGGGSSDEDMDLDDDEEDEGTRTGESPRAWLVLSRRFVADLHAFFL